MTDDEFRAVVLNCKNFLAGHYPQSVSQRLEDIAQSPYAQMPADNYGAGGFVSVLEQELAELFGKEAAVFMPSGTMAQPIALRIWADRTGNKSVAFHPKCHLQCHEHMAYAELHGLNGILLGEADRLFTLDDLVTAGNEAGTLLIELPQRDLGGELPSHDELAEVIGYAKSRSMNLHLDGARLWECLPYFGTSYREIVEPFDSLYVSFYKILGGLPGAALVGPADFIAEARIWMRRHGGNLHNSFAPAIAAKMGMDRHLPRMAQYVLKAQEIALALQDLPGLKVYPESPKTNMFHLHFEASEESIMSATVKVALETGCMLIRYVAEGDGFRTTEIPIGEAALDFPTLDIRKNFELLLEYCHMN